MSVHFAMYVPHQPRRALTLTILSLAAVCLCGARPTLAGGADAIGSIVEARALIASDATNPDHYLTASEVATRLGDQEAALKFLEEGRKRALPSAELLVQLGTMYTLLNRSGEAEKTLSAALALDPDSISAHLQMGELCNLLGRHEAALKNYDHVLALEPGHTEAQCRLVFTMLAAGRAVEAEEACLSFIALDRQKVDLWLALGEALEQQERLQDAFACYGHALKVDSSAAAPHSRRGRLYCRFGQFDAAALECRAALALDSEDPLAHAYLGIACAQLGQDEEARNHALKAEAAGMHMQSVWEMLGR
jgi:tetratricopeptide (TPR) repeat protein